MTYPTIKMKITPAPRLRGKMDVRFPANVEATGPIVLTKNGGEYIFSLDSSALVGDLSPVYLSKSDVEYVKDRAELANYALSSARVFIMSAANQPTEWIPVTGDQSAFITAGDPRFVAPASDPTGASGAFVAVGSIQTGQFYQEDGARIHRLADRVFIGGAVEHTGEQVVDNNDWLTAFQIAVGRSGGWIQLSQAAILNGVDPEGVFTLTSGVQTQHITMNGLNGTADYAIGINNNTTYNLHVYARYTEAFRMPGAIGGAYGHEIDVVNYEGLVTINPFSQSAGQTVGLQVAAGAELDSTGQYPVSAALNIRKNGATYKTGIVFGNDAIEGTDGSTGAGEAISFGTLQYINYYYQSGGVSWQFAAMPGANGDYNITTNGTGSVSLPRVKTNHVKFPSSPVLSTDPNTLDDYKEFTFTPTLTFGGGNTGMVVGTALGRGSKVGSRVDFVLVLSVTNKGSSTGTALVGGLPYTASASFSVAAECRCSGISASINNVKAQVGANATTISFASFAAGALTGMTDADFLTAISIRVTGHYYVD